MQATIEKVSRYGVMVDGVWRNLSKFHKVDLSSFNAGDLVDIELQKDKFITKLEHSNGEQTTTEVTNGSNNTATRTENTGDRQAVIVRQSAYNAVLGSVWFGNFVRDMDYSEAVDSAFQLIDALAKYALTGERHESE